MNKLKETARLAGLVYLVVILTGIFSLAYVPSRLIVWGNAAQTFQNISSSTQLFRLGIASSMICYLAFLVLPLILYKLLRQVNITYAQLMVTFAVVSVPVSFINLQNKFSIIMLIERADYLKIYSTQQVQAQLMTYLNTYSTGILIAQLFWGLWLYPFGFLVYRSAFLPKILGVLLMLGCVGYIVSTFGETLIPDFSQTIISKFITLPASLGEVGICLWLLTFGIKDNKNASKSK